MPKTKKTFLAVGVLTAGLLSGVVYSKLGDRIRVCDLSGECRSLSKSEYLRLRKDSAEVLRNAKSGSAVPTWQELQNSLHVADMGIKENHGLTTSGDILNGVIANLEN